VFEFDIKINPLLRRGVQQFLIGLLLALWGVPLQAQSKDEAFRATLNELREAEFDAKEMIVERLTQTGHSSIRAVLAAYLEDRLFYRNDDMKVVLVKTTENDPPMLELVDPVSLKDAGTIASDQLTKIGTNNRLRRSIRTLAAKFGLENPDPAIRLEAARDMVKSLDENSVALLRDRAAVETDASVKNAIATGLALSALSSDNVEERVKAIETLRGSMNSDVRNKLASFLEKNPDGSFVETEPRIRDAAKSALSGIDRWHTFYSGIQTLFFGLSLGSVLVLVAIGLAITFGVMGVINMAHGELMMIGAYTTYVVQQAMPNHIAASILVSIPAAFLVSGVVGVLIERTIIRFLYGRPLETLLATFGLSLVLQQVVRSIFSALNREVKTPEFMSGMLEINEGLSVTYNRLYVVAFTLVVFFILLAVLKRTRLGLDIRAVSQNRAMARAMGIRSEWVDAMTFGLGSGIAGVAGVALSQLTNVGPNLGQSYIIDSFMVVVFGGVGNLWGALVGGMSMGIVKKLLEPYSGAVLADVLVLVALILFIQRRPRGLFPQTGRSADNS
jgi:urea transport system permease protein